VVPVAQALLPVDFVAQPRVAVLPVAYAILPVEFVALPRVAVLRARSSMISKDHGQGPEVPAQRVE
jgi:hypothetical protein